MDKKIIIELFKALFDFENNIAYSINGKKRDKCTITEMDEKEDKIYLEYDYIEDLKTLKIGRISCYLTIDKIKSVEVNAKENACNIIYNEVE